MFNSFSKIITISQTVLSICITMFSGSFKPADSFIIVLFNSFSKKIKISKQVLSFYLTFFSCSPIPAEGFIVILFSSYTFIITISNPLAEYRDMEQFMSDIVQFSYSILLNNLSISMSKYLGLKIFLDYKFTLQEATDLKTTKFLVYPDTSLRWILPQQYSLTYTFKYEPAPTKMTHKVMLQKSLRFKDI